MKLLLVMSRKGRPRIFVEAESRQWNIEKVEKVELEWDTSSKPLAVLDKLEALSMGAIGWGIVGNKDCRVNW